MLETTTSQNLKVSLVVETYPIPKMGRFGDGKRHLLEVVGSFCAKNDMVQNICT